MALRRLVIFVSLVVMILTAWALDADAGGPACTMAVCGGPDGCFPDCSYKPPAWRYMYNAGQEEANVKSPSWKRSGLYLNRNSKIVSIQRAPRAISDSSRRR